MNLVNASLLHGHKRGTSLQPVIPLGLREEEAPFPAESFPVAMKDYGDALSKTFGAPVGLFLMMELGAISGAAGKAWRLKGAVQGHQNYAICLF